MGKRSRLWARGSKSTGRHELVDTQPKVSSLSTCTIQCLDPKSPIYIEADRRKLSGVLLKTVLRRDPTSRHTLDERIVFRQWSDTPLGETLRRESCRSSSLYTRPRTLPMS